MIGDFKRSNEVAISCEIGLFLGGVAGLEMPTKYEGFAGGWGLWNRQIDTMKKKSWAVYGIRRAVRCRGVGKVENCSCVFAAGASWHNAFFWDKESEATERGGF